MTITAHSLLTTELTSVLLLLSDTNYPLLSAPAILVTVVGAECGFKFSSLMCRRLSPIGVEKI
jgi:hypothetical protein